MQFADRKNNILHTEQEVSEIQNASSENTEYNQESGRSSSSSLSERVIF